MTDSHTLRKRIADLEAFMQSEVFTVWLASRNAEIQLYNTGLAFDAKSWDEVVEIRARRDNTADIQNTFQELCETLKAELDQAIESETQLAGNTKI